MKLKILTTSECDGGCTSCSVRPWMNYHRRDPYHLSIDQLKNIIAATEDSNYVVDEIVLLGGEPFKWGYLETGLLLLHRHFPDSVIKIISNGLIFKQMNLKILHRVFSYIDQVIISAYYGNEKSIDFALTFFGDAIRVTDNRIRLVAPNFIDIQEWKENCRLWVSNTYFLWRLYRLLFTN